MNVLLKKLKLDYVIPSNCEEFHVPLLNEKIIKNNDV